MKRQLIFSVFLFFGWMANAQNIPNASFDSVYFGGIDRLFDWITADGIRMVTGTNWPDTVYALEPDSTYNGSGFMFHELLWMNNQSDTSPHSFASTVVIHRPNWYKTTGGIFPGFIMAGNSLTTDSDGYPDFSRSGIPFVHRPTKLHGYYHFVDSTVLLNNFGKCIILLSKWNAANQQRDTIAFAETTTELSPTFGFTPFEITLNYRTAQMPDTLMLAFFGSTILQNPAALWLDELSFSYGGIDIPENEKPRVSVYPIPAKEFLKIEAPVGATYILNDLHGRIIGAGFTSESVAISDFEPQILLLRVYLNGRLLESVRISKME
jgi:hypothetical protein